MSKRQKKHAGFTLVELLVALMIAAIVLAAAATMADAMSCAKEACDQMSRSTAYLLQIQTRLSDLIMRANEVVENDNQHVKLKYIDGEGTETFVIISADGSGNIIIGDTTYMYQWKDKGLYKDAQSNVQFVVDGKLVTVKFDLTENGVAQTYQVCAALRGK
jgi:prepilin-type N-terminal cleavage/methylation domain-containing protein